MSKYIFDKLQPICSGGSYCFYDGSSDYNRILESLKEGAFIISASRSQFRDYSPEEELTEKKFEGVKEELNEFGIEVESFEDLAKHPYSYLKQWNEAKTLDMIKTVREKGLGYRACYGGFIEDNGNIVKEKSILVKYRDGSLSREDFLKLAIDLCKKYNQESVLVSMEEVNGGKPTYLTQNGSVDFDFEKIRQTKEDDQYFTETVKHNSKPFTLDSLAEEIAKNHMTPNSQSSKFARLFKTDGWNI